jgi:hypothetical protein
LKNQYTTYLNAGEDIFFQKKLVEDRWSYKRPELTKKRSKRQKDAQMPETRGIFA